jgi:hypothetical protein
LSAKLPIIAVLIRAGLGNIFGKHILPQGQRFELTFYRWFNTCCVSLRVASSVARFDRFDSFLWDVGNNMPRSVALVVSPRLRVLVIVILLCSISCGIFAL